MYFRQLSSIIMYVSMPGKLLDINFNVSLFSNLVEKVLILDESMGQICPLDFLL